MLSFLGWKVNKGNLLKNSLIFFFVGVALWKNSLLSATIVSPITSDNKLRVFFDCNVCDKSYIISHVPIINIVRMPEDAEVCVVVKTVFTGVGSKYFLIFQGQEKFSGINDTLDMDYTADATVEETRNGALNVIKIGLLRFFMRSEWKKRIEVIFPAPSTDNSIIEDAWDNWAFTISANGSISAQQTFRSLSFNSSLSASRITEEWKSVLSALFIYNQSNFYFDDQTINSYMRSSFCSALSVRSLDDHFSTGASASISSSLYNNDKLTVSIGPAIEYSVFPYSEYIYKNLTFLYKLNYTNSHYYEETVYNKISENLLSGSLSATYNFKEIWGSANSSVELFNYLPDLRKGLLNLSGSVSFLVSRGISFSVSGQLSFIRNQLSLPKSGITEEEVLLQRRALETNFSYSTSVGLSYSFGSIYNTIFNPRMGN